MVAGMRGNVRAALASAAVAFALASAASAAAAAPLIHAHRGGTVVAGKPTYTEESLDAYRAAARDGFVLEVDAKLTADGVPVAIHDATLDRTTNCTGEVAARTEDALRACRPDVLGSPGGGLRTRTVSPRGRIATIAEVLELARLTGAAVNLEIKNLPTDPDWDPTTAYANRVMDVVLESGLPRSQLLIQSFLPGNLDVAKRRLRGVPTSFLTLGADPANIASTRDAGYTWISPQWPFAAGLRPAGAPPEAPRRRVHAQRALRRARRRARRGRRADHRRPVDGRPRARPAPAARAAHLVRAPRRPRRGRGAAGAAARRDRGGAVAAGS